MKTKANIEKLFELIVKTTFFIEKKEKKCVKLILSPSTKCRNEGKLAAKTSLYVRQEDSVHAPPHSFFS